MRKFLAVAAVLIQCAAAQAQFFGCSEWEKLRPTMRAVYMAGAFDSLTGFAADEIGRRVSEHYTVCVGRSRLDNSRLAENVRRFLNKHHESHESSVQAALVNYLISLCGVPPHSDARTTALR